MAVAEALEIVSFAAGSFRFAVEAAQIKGMFSEPPKTLVAVETLLGLPLLEAAQRRYLRVGALCVAVSEPLDLRPLPVENVFPLPELVAARIQIKGVAGLALETDGATLLLDLQVLLAQSVRQQED